ncbi:hypothetical protein [Burkholderia pseudomallei]|uniref:hypothetical protein n=1 Tax=Burkholderia pseudomallei TaxID=28450 RepID=UPI0011AB5945|nr:hypothetical protein [Burkholderia pseudomallei]
MIFVSLAELIESIAPFVPISVIWQNATEHSEEQAPTDDQAQSVVLDLISTYRRSGVAAELVDYLRKTEADARPSWRKSDAAGALEALDDDVLSRLEQISCHYSRLLKGTDLRRADLHDQHVHDHERWARREQFRQASELRAERRGVIGFLDHYGIPHTLDGRPHDMIRQSNVKSLRASSRSVDGNTFVSLYEVLHAVAPYIRIDAQDARDYSSNLGTAYSFGAEPEIGLAGPTEELEWQAILIAPVCRLFQESRAAEQLLAVFGSGNAGDLPKWREQRSGKSLALPGLEVKGMQELVRLSELEAQYKADYDRSRRYSLRVTTKPKTGELSLEAPMLDLRKRSRLHEIGFIRSDIIPILDDHEIKHNLGRIGGPSIADKIRAPSGKRSLTTRELADAFGDVDGGGPKTGRDSEEWEAYMQGKSPSWLRWPHIRVQKGGSGRGNSAYWNPVEFAKAAWSKGKIPLKAFDDRFEAVKELAPWKDDWQAWRSTEAEMADENPARKPGKFPGWIPLKNG